VLVAKRTKWMDRPSLNVVIVAKAPKTLVMKL
jgi:hypothetical protein